MALQEQPPVPIEEESPTEATPLLQHSPAEEDGRKVHVSFLQGLTIVASTGLLLFIQGIYCIGGVMSKD